MNAIRWVFFDIGSTLVDEEEAYHHRIRDMIRGTSITFEQFSEKRIQYAKAGYNGDQKAIEYFALNKTPWHSEDEVPFHTILPSETFGQAGFFGSLKWTGQTDLPAFSAVPAFAALRPERPVLQNGSVLISRTRLFRRVRFLCCGNRSKRIEFRNRME